MSAVAIVVPGVVFGVQQANPRSTINNARNVARSADTESNAAVRRSATSVIARSTVLDKRQSRPVVTARPATVRGATVRSARQVVKGANVARSASKSSAVRSATKAKTGIGGVNVSRAGKARATAVFNDVSKIGGGYSGCRDAYATCMDQMCANANDTYRRCFCSDRFTEFRDTSDRLDEALKLLAEFQNVNLDAVNKTAAEVDAMYSATEGEEAIKRDTSASQKLLDSISDVLSSKSKSSSKKTTYSNSSSLGVLDLTSFTNSGNPFGDSSSVFGDGPSSIFGGTSSNYTDISTLEGADLYDAAMQQCTQITRESCGGDAMFNLARSSYSILITQDCNAYEKNIDAKKKSVEDTVRTAEKYLREARLEEYRAHNSADVNECLTAVDTAMRQPLACGPNLEGCLDFTGLYINPTTGEPVYSQALFGLNNVIVLNGSSDVLSSNSNYLQEFEKRKKQFAEGALDTCRGIADTVWEEYKRMVLIQVAQAQDDKIEQVKNSCVSTIKECYDTQTGAMNSLVEDVSASSTKAISAIAARDACKQKVFACAALYGDVDGCTYDDATKKISANEGKKCGMQSLLALVDAADTVRFEKGCEDALREYVEETCEPSSGDSHKYPWGCVKMSPAALKEMLKERAEIVCANDFGSDYSINDVRGANGNVVTAATKAVSKSIVGVEGEKNVDLTKSGIKIARAAVSTNSSTTSKTYGGRLDLNTDEFIDKIIIDKIIDDVKREMEPILRDECYAVQTEGNLIFDPNGFSLANGDTVNVSPTWTQKVFGSTSVQVLVNTGVVGYGINLLRGGTQAPDTSKKPSLGWGVCMQPSESQLCAIQNQIPGMSGTAVFGNSKCELTNDWYKNKCQQIGGYIGDDDNCWVKK